MADFFAELRLSARRFRAERADALAEAIDQAGELEERALHAEAALAAVEARLVELEELSREPDLDFGRFNVAVFVHGVRTAMRVNAR